MTQYRSNDLKNALEAARPAFQSEKIGIDEISNDIRLLEKDLNELGATDRFSFAIEVLPVRSLATPMSEPNAFRVPFIGHELMWQKHGDSWRLFYGTTWRGIGLVKATDQTQWAHEEDEELLAQQSAPDRGNPSTWPAGMVITCKPLIDTKRETRTISHIALPEFVAAFAKNWSAQKYQVVLNS